MKALTVAGAVVCLATQLVSAQAASPAQTRSLDPCAWQPPATESTVRVRSIDDLHRALARVQRSTTILIERGDYRLDHTVNVSSQTVLRGATGNPADVVLRGSGMNEGQVGVAVSIDGSDVVVADLSIRDVGYHGIQVRGENGISHVLIRDVHISDTGQQLIKGSTDGARHSDDVVVACSTLDYTDHAPSNYTNGVDVLGGTNWVVRDNRIARIHGPAAQGFSAGPAILFWANAGGTQVERNVIIDSFRGIAFGLVPGTSLYARNGDRTFDHQGGFIRNNVVVNLNAWADEGIEANAAGSVTIDHNTVLVNGALPWAISLRFPPTTASVRNNLTSKPLTRRNGGQGSEAGNVSGAAADWFIDARAADLRLAHSGSPAIGAGVPLPDVTVDATGRPRPGTAPTAGAFEYAEK